MPEPAPVAPTAKKGKRKPFQLVLGGALLTGVLVLFGVLGATQFWSVGGPTEVEPETVAVAEPSPEAEDVATSRSLALENAADDAAWARAQEFATVTAYTAYLEDEDYAVHRAEAQVAIDRHEQAVLRLQTALNAKGFDAGTADGAVGRKTRAAVEAYRGARNFDVSAIDLAAIDAEPINALAESAERWERPRPEPAQTTQVASSGATTAGTTAPRRPGQTLRDALTGAREVRTLEGHGDWVWSAAFSPDGRFVVTGSSDDTAKLWELEFE